METLLKFEMVQRPWSIGFLCFTRLLFAEYADLDKVRLSSKDSIILTLGYACFGDRELAVISLKYELVGKLKFPSWILDVKLLDDGEVLS